MSVTIDAPASITIVHPGGTTVISVQVPDGGAGLTPSPDGTAVTTVGPTIIDAALRSFTICAADASNKGQQVGVNGVRDTRTGEVIRLYAKGGVCSQENKYHDWYSLDSANVWHQVPNPTGEAPPVIPPVQPVFGVPPMAAAQGYNMRTLGPALGAIGDIWRVNGNSNVRQNADGSVTLAGPWNANNQINTTNTRAFGGGAYMEADFKFDNAYNGNGGWPAWWSNSLEGREIAFPNQRGVEPDFCEFWGNSNWGAALHDWYGGQGSKVTQGTAVDMPSGQSGNQRHRYGCLWVMATNSAKGRLEFYYDRVLQPRMTVVWDKYRHGDQPPYANGTTAGANIDVQHLGLILGTSVNNPMTVYAVEVWQRDGSANLPPT